LSIFRGIILYFSLLPLTDEYIIAYDLYFQHAEPVAACVGAVPVAKIKAQMMPAADHLVAFETTAIQRLILMRAEEGRGVVASVLGIVENTVGVVADTDLLPGSRGDFAHFADKVKDLLHPLSAANLAHISAGRSKPVFQPVFAGLMKDGQHVELAYLFIRCART
jgi:hypothetical protein